MLKNLKNKNWWVCSLVRAIKTFAQAMISNIGMTAVTLSEVPWLTVLSASALAALLSILTSLSGLPEVEHAEVSEDINGDN